MTESINGGYTYSADTYVPKGVEDSDGTKAVTTRRGLTLKQKLMVGLGGVVLASTLTACGPADGGYIDTTPTEEPGPTNSETAAPVPVFETTELPADLAEEDTISPAEYRTLPEQDRLEYWSWLTSYKQEFADRFVAVSARDSDKLVDASLENSAEQILTQSNYNYRIAASLADENGSHDVDAVSKIMSSLYYNPETNYLLDPAIESVLNNPSIYSVDDMALAHAYESPAVESSSDVYTDPQGRKSKDIVYLNEDGTKVTLVYTYVEFTDYQGNSDSAWLLISRTF